MSTPYSTFTDRDGKLVVVDASGIAQRINLEGPAGMIYLRLDQAAADKLLWGLRLSYEHNNWELPF